MSLVQTLNDTIIIDFEMTCFILSDNYLLNYAMELLLYWNWVSFFSLNTRANRQLAAASISPTKFRAMEAPRRGASNLFVFDLRTNILYFLYCLVSLGRLVCHSLERQPVREMCNHPRLPKSCLLLEERVEVIQSVCGVASYFMFLACKFLIPIDPFYRIFIDSNILLFPLQDTLL